MLKCVLCDKQAIGTAAHIPVCEEHYKAYDEEGFKYLPLAERKVYLRLIAAYEEQTGKSYWG